MSSAKTVAEQAAARTPGPWITDGVVVWASDDGGQSFDVPVCVTTSRVKNALVEPAAMAPTCGLANADLIAASPDLLEAARAARSWVDMARSLATSPATVGHTSGALALLDAAIARAEGK